MVLELLNMVNSLVVHSNDANRSNRTMLDYNETTNTKHVLHPDVPYMPLASTVKCCPCVAKAGKLLIYMHTAQNVLIEVGPVWHALAKCGTQQIIFDMACREKYSGFNLFFYSSCHDTNP